MKKSILFSMLALGMGLFSCSQEDLSGNGSQSGQPVTVTVQLPEDAVGRASSRYLPTADAHQLRCILYVTNSDGSWTERIEKVASEAVNETFSFTFTPEDATDYKCTFWADFIAADAAVTGEGDDRKYADLYYNTQVLPTVSYNTDVATNGSLFNNEGCDAYCGTIPTGGALSVKLTRPFAKISFNDSGSTIESTDKFSINGYKVYGSFDIESNAVSGETEIACTDIAPADKTTDKTWFYNYLFVGDKNALPGESLSMTVNGVTKTVEFNGNLSSLTSNTQVNAGFDWGEAESDGSVNITVGFDSGWADPNAPKVGDYYYSDGTWSTTLDSKKTPIGVVFAVKGDGSAIDSDATANYSGVSFKDNKIHGWVVSLKEIAPTPRFASKSDGSAGVAVGAIIGVNTETTDIKGYANCSAWKSNTLADGAVYTALLKVESYATDYSAAFPDTGTSGWYIGAIAQMDALRSAYNATDSKVKAALETLVADEGAAALFATGTGASAYYWSSTANQAEDKNSVRIIVFDASVGSYMATQDGSSGRHCRPILTF